MTGSGADGWSLGLLERALGYTGGVLRDLPAEVVGLPTPCRGWDLEQLLAHLEDALDAFREAAAGAVRVDPPALPDDPTDRPGRLERKARALLRAWSRAAPGDVPRGDVRVGEVSLAAEVLVPAAALEIAVHGWDVARSVGGPGLDPALASDLAPVAALLVPPGPGRAGRFDPPPADLCGPGTLELDTPDRLWGWLGRGQATGSETRKRAPSPRTPA